jgi:hypothetical protein
MEAVISEWRIGQLLESHAVAVEKAPSPASMDGSSKEVPNPHSGG